MKTTALFLLLIVLSSCKKEKEKPGPIQQQDSVTTAPEKMTTDLERTLDSLLTPIRLELHTFAKELSKYSVWQQDSLLAETERNWSNNRDSLESFLSSEMVVNRQYEDPIFSRKVDSLLQNVGMVIWSSEGYYFPISALGLRLDTFDKSTSEAAKEWLLLTTRFAKTQESADAGISVPLDTFANWARSLESFERKYPQTPISSFAQQKRAHYLALIISGLDNTPSFENNIVVPEFLTVWKQFAEHERQTESGKYIGEWYDFLTAQNFQWTEACDDWARNNQLSVWIANQKVTEVAEKELPIH